jgi:hypothetical protein
MKHILGALMLAVLCLLAAPQTARAQYAYGSSSISYDPVSKQVYGYSRTSVDYYAGAYYDPYVEGFLYSGLSNYPVDAGADRGYEDWIPAEVNTSTFSTPSTRYDVISDHYVISWYSVSVTVCDYYGFYDGCGYDPYGFGFLGGGWFGGFGNFFGPGYGGYVPERTYYLGSTGIGGVTPPPDTCSSSSSTYSTGDGSTESAPAYEYDSTSSSYRDTYYFSSNSACPEPTPTPPAITAQVTEVGFSGDYTVKRFANGDVTKQTAYDPDNATPTWKKDKNPDAPVAYKMGQQPTMFATLTLSPAPTSSVTAKIQVKKGSDVIAMKDVSLSGANVRITDIPVTAALENPAVVKRGDYKFTWEISYDGGASWKPMGSSSHKIYWLYSDPIANEFTDFFGNQYDGLFDEALKHTAGETGSGSSDIDEVIFRITKGEANDIYYRPSKVPVQQHPLMYFKNRSAVCAENALVLRGLLRSIGIDGQVLYYWGGDPASKTKYRYNFNGNKPTFQIIRRQNDEAEENPHFLYHAVVRAGASNLLYDPSYGRRDPSVDFNETYNPSANHFTQGATESRPFTVENTTLNSPETTFNVSCPHEAQRLSTPNPIDTPSNFVAQQYLDLLRREPDDGGLNFWTGQITNCGSDSNCVSYMRTQVAKAFFLSREFQQTGLYVYYLYKASYLRQPTMEEFSTGQEAVGQGFIDGTPGADAVLESNQEAFSDAWVESDEFKAMYDGLANDQYVDTLFANIGVTPDATQRQSLLDGLNNGTETRASVLRTVISNPTFKANEDHPAFVLSEYFGFLRRNPSDPPDNDMSGYNFWLGQYNTYNDQNSMVTAFITSIEYRSRFGQP